MMIYLIANGAKITQTEELSATDKAMAGLDCRILRVRVVENEKLDLVVEEMTLGGTWDHVPSHVEW